MSCLDLSVKSAVFGCLTNTIASNYARELFKGSNRSASLLVAFKKNFCLGVVDFL